MRIRPHHFGDARGGHRKSYPVHSPRSLRAGYNRPCRDTNKQSYELSPPHVRAPHVTAKCYTTTEGHRCPCKDSARLPVGGSCKAADIDRLVAQLSAPPLRKRQFT